MRAQVADPVTLSFERGVDTRSRETRLPPGAVRDARNVDITREGNLLRRRGWRQLVATTHGHSLWSDPRWPVLLYVDAGQLQAYDPVDTSTYSLGSVGDLPTSFCWHAGEVFLTNALVTLRLDNTLTLRACGVGTPPLPRVRVVATALPSLLLESGDNLLLESGDNLLLEA